MRKSPALLVLAGFVLAAGGCSRVNGEKYAEKVNEKMTAKINSGEVKSLSDMAKVEESIQREVLKEMGFDPDKAKITESEKKKFEEKLKTYAEGWAKLLIEKSAKKP